MHMRECVQQDYLGRFYEDFYRYLYVMLVAESQFLIAIK